MVSPEMNSAMRVSAKMDSSNILSFPEYSYWYEAVRNDDVDTLKRELSKNDTNKLNKLLNGTFKFDDPRQEKPRKRNQEMFVSNVWHLVVTLCSEDTIKLFLTKSVHIHSTIKCDYNIIHTMIFAAGSHPEHEDVLMKKYNFIMKNISNEDKLRLLQWYNADGMRPLDFSLHNTSPGMFTGILLLL